MGRFAFVVLTTLVVLAADMPPARADVLTTIGDVTTGPGGSVQLPVSLSGTGNAVGGVQLDLLYPTAVFSLTNPSDPCALVSGRPGDVYTSLPSSPPPPSGMTRLRIIVLDTGGDSYGDGSLLTCGFTAASGAPLTTYNLDVEEYFVSDTVGNLLPASVDEGSIRLCSGCC